MNKFTSYHLKINIYNSKLMNKPFLRLKKHYLPLLSLILIAVLIFYFERNTRDIITFITQATGYISIIILTISLIIGTTNLLLKRRNPISSYLRRDISIVGGILAVIHSVAGLFVHLRGKNWQYFLNKTEHGYSIRLDSFGLANYTGLISALILLILLITSNDYFFKKLNQSYWKNIQRLSYLMFILALIHCFYYRIVKENLNLIYWIYIPLFITVLIFQMIGVYLKLSDRKITQDSGDKTM
jgi:sulfoxide reductase heme-binding subunit YedZ